MAGSPFLVRLGRRLEEAREEKRLSQSAVARAAKLSRQHLARIEKGEVEPGSEKLRNIARAVGLSGDLLELDADSAPSMASEKRVEYRARGEMNGLVERVEREAARLSKLAAAFRRALAQPKPKR